MTRSGPPARDPIPIEAIPLIKAHLWENRRNAALFIIGLNTGLRACDLAKLQLGDFMDEDHCFREQIRIKQQKTKNFVTPAINGAIKDAITRWLEDNPAKLDAYLFYTTVRGHQRNYSKPITSGHITVLVNQWCDAIGLKGNFGAHSLRKTRGMTIYKAASESVGASQALLITARTLGHSSIANTMEYLGINMAEVADWQNKVEL